MRGKEGNTLKKNFYLLKVVKSHKDHECIVCGNIISKGSRTLVESGFNRNDGFFSNYFHIDKKSACHLDYLDACQPNDLTIPSKLRDESFFGELMFNRWKETI